MRYGQPDTMERITALEKRVHQLEVSARTGSFRVESAFDATASALTTSAEDVWAEPTAGNNWVTVETGEEALVLVTAKPIISATSKFAKVLISYAVSGDTTIAAGNVGTQVRTAELETSTASPIFTSSTIVLIYRESGLTPGDNTFTMMGMYDLTVSAGPVPTIENRGIVVIPVDV